jgi:hypothetical protein
MTSSLLVADTPPVDGWSRLPHVSREDLGDEGIRGGRFGKLDRAAKLLALGARRALAGTLVDPATTGLVLATLTGSLAADEAFDATRVRPEGASPLLFPATLPTAPAAELSLRYGLEGPVLSVRSSVKAAFAVARLLVLSGQAERVLACGLEVAARGAARFLGIEGPFRESVSVFLVDRAVATRFAVPLLSALETPRGALLANEPAAALAAMLEGAPGSFDRPPERR